MREISTLGLIALVCADVSSQDRTREWAEARSELARAEVTPDQRIARLTSFVVRHAATEEGARSQEVLAARSQLGSLWLRELDAERAGLEFDRITELVAASEIDLRGRALYGSAQAAELQGDSERARELYGRLTRELAGTRYADFARVAAHRLERPDVERPRPGRPAPEFGPALDRTGSARRLADLDGRPALLVFVDPTDEMATARLTTLVGAARQAGLTDAAMVTFSTTVGDDLALTTLARSAAFQMPIVPSPDGFLSPAFLRYQIRSVPTTILIGPDGTLLGRDLPPRRLREVLARLRR